MPDSAEKTSVPSQVNHQVSGDSPITTLRGKSLRFFRWTSIALIVGSLLTLIRSLPIDRGMDALNGWITGLGFWGPVVMALVYVAATVLFVPGTILTLAAGAIFGLGLGTATVSVGSTLGASLAFLIARYVARDKIAAMASQNRRFGAIDRAIGEGGWKIVALLRLSPAIPFNIQNYMYGLTPVRFWPYAVASWIAMLPGTFLYVYIGHITGAALGAKRERGPGEWAMMAVGLLATVAVSIYVTKLARRKLQEQMDAEAQSDKSSDAEQEHPNITYDRLVWKTFRLMVAALLLVGAATYVRANADKIENWFAGMFGPPRVELTEAYSNDSSGPTFDHSVFDTLLKQHVDANGWVDYTAMRTNQSQLDQYLDSVAKAPLDQFSRDDRLAFLINAYNACTLKLILDHYPLDSIMDIPDAERWDAVRWNIGGNQWSLNQIEHEQIRPKFIEPRIHFALVCAAVGCPPLRNEAYDPARLEEQLDQQSRYVHEHSTWFKFDADKQTVSLTKLYSWYGSDFDQVAGSPVRFAAKYSEPLRQALDRSITPTQQWLPYDWALNRLENARPR